MFANIWTISNTIEINQKVWPIGIGENGDIMKIRVKKNAYVYASDTETRMFLNLNEGIYVDVDTKYMFDNQYNVDGFRLYDTMIDGIIEDVRTGPELFFIENPNGLPVPDVRDRTDLYHGTIPSDVKYGDGAYDTIECLDSLGFFRVHFRNDYIRFVYNPNTDVFYEEGIGYTKISSKKLFFQFSEKRRQAIIKTMRQIYKQP